MKLPNILIATDFACGGIVTTILNNQQIKWNPRLDGSVDSYEHQDLKTIELFHEGYRTTKPGVWYHTHIEDVPLDLFDEKLIITTENIYSRYIIFLRCYKFLHPNWTEDTTPESIDKIRELAKTYAIPKIIKARSGCKSIELIDLIEGDHELFDTNNAQWEIWKEKNIYLYEKNMWTLKRFSEAVWETENQQLFKYT